MTSDRGEGGPARAGRSGASVDVARAPASGEGHRDARDPVASRGDAPVTTDVTAFADAGPSIDCGGPPARRLEVAVRSDVAEIEPLVAQVAASCADFGYPPRLVGLNVPVALSEALANAIVSGNGSDPRKQVRLRACVSAERVVLEVADQGPGFDLEACIHRPDEPDFREREDGRGLFLMRRLMDRVEQVRPTGWGSAVRLTLLRAPADPTAAATP